ncbi:hypothetical protein DER45DRAFT_601325 [Fusarium avenaceum]|nr:hypothetical protein DER45DRAFT_601325 [Fusarium avenaceum]
MMNLRLLFLLLGSLAPLTGASKDLEQMPESWCITYLSTYLIPISVAPSSPAESRSPDLETSFSLDRSLSQLDPEPTSSTPTFVPSRDETSLLATVDTTSAPPSATTDASTDGELVILRVVTDLLAGGNPIYYNGEGFKVLRAQGRTPSGAITRTFTRDGNKLRFQSSRFPTGEAGFCQTPSDGQVYITFSSEPAGCIPVTILVVSSEQCQDESVVVSTTAASESQQFVSTSFLESVIPTTSSSGQGPPTVSTRPDDVITTRSVIPAPIPSSSFMWSNISSSSQPPPKTQRSSSFIPLKTTEVSTAETTESTTNKSSTQIVELTSTTKDVTTSTFQTTTLANSQTTTESTAGGTLINTTTEGSTTDIPTSTNEESTTDIPTSTNEESTTNVPTTSSEESTTNIQTTSSKESTLEIPITTTLSSALDLTTETTTEAATTTTAEAAPQIVCPSNPQQCFNTMLISCDTVVGGIPLTPGSFSAQECFEKCYLDSACMIWTHSGTQCFLTNNLSDNQGQFGIQGWTSGIKGHC